MFSESNNNDNWWKLALGGAGVAILAFLVGRASKGSSPKELSSDTSSLEEVATSTQSTTSVPTTPQTPASPGVLEVPHATVIEDLREEIDQLNEQYDIVRKQYDQAISRKKDSDVEIEELEEELEQVRSEVEEKLRQKGEVIARLQEENAQLAKQLDAIKRKFSGTVNRVSPANSPVRRGSPGGARLTLAYDASTSGGETTPGTPQASASASKLRMGGSRDGQTESK